MAILGLMPAPRTQRQFRIRQSSPRGARDGASRDATPASERPAFGKGDAVDAIFGALVVEAADLGAGGAAQVGHGTVGLDGAHVVVEIDVDEIAAFFEGGHREGSGACGEVEDHVAQAKGTVRTKKRRPRGFERRLLVSPDCPRGKTVSSSDTARPPSQRAFLCQLRFWKVFKGFGRM
ncbi:MAG: hypothetical protein IKC51_01485, partial [Myxococcaceae bacterium]|nr:hypothetical protein [Myxococcaceae bacterium]